MKSMIGILAALLLVMASCSKKVVKLSPDNLTGCPAGAKCDYAYTIGDDPFPRSRRPHHHMFRYTENRIGACQITRTLWIRIPIEWKRSRFAINKENQNDSLVIFTKYGPCAKFPPMKVMGGYVKAAWNGPPGSLRWLLDINLVVASEPTGEPVDTIRVKQFFHRSFEIN